MATPNPLITPVRSALAGSNIMLMGPAGTGKTHSIGTLVDSGIEVFYLGLESGLESLIGYYTDKGLPIPDNLHYHMLKAPEASFEALLSAATKINQFSFDSLAKMQDPDRHKHNRFLDLLTALNDFPDDRTGQKFGSVKNWDATRAVVIDGLTGVCAAAKSLVVGAKPVISPSDWQVAQDTTEKLIRMLCDNCPCHFVLIAHVEREVDQILGGVKLMASALGQKLAPKLPPMFSDVILTVRNGDKWVWDTANVMADVKTRNLTISANNPQSFGPVIAKWRAREKVLQ